MLNLLNLTLFPKILPYYITSSPYKKALYMRFFFGDVKEEAKGIQDGQSDDSESDRFIIKYKDGINGEGIKEALRNEIKGSRKLRNKNIEVITTKEKVKKDGLLATGSGKA